MDLDTDVNSGLVNSLLSQIGLVKEEDRVVSTVVSKSSVFLWEAIKVGLGMKGLNEPVILIAVLDKKDPAGVGWDIIN